MISSAVTAKGRTVTVMSEDMTFCDDSDECENKKCFRHKCHIKHFEIQHSFAHLKGTNYCERKDGDENGECEKV